MSRYSKKGKFVYSKLYQDWRRAVSQGREAEIRSTSAAHTEHFGNPDALEMNRRSTKKYGGKRQGISIFKI